MCSVQQVLLSSGVAVKVSFLSLSTRRYKQSKQLISVPLQPGIRLMRVELIQIIMPRALQDNTL